MIISDIKPAKKALSILYIDGEYAMKLDTATLAENCIKVGTELDDDELKELIDKSNYKRAKEKALWLISGRDYSEKKLAEKLRKDFPEDVAEKVCERMEELGLLDDEKYAKRLADDLVYNKKMSIKGAKYKLMEKGISRELCEEILEEYEIDAVNQIIELIDDKYSLKINDEKGRRRTIAALQRMGYSWGDISSALAIYEEDY